MLFLICSEMTPYPIYLHLFHSLSFALLVHWPSPIMAENRVIEPPARRKRTPKVIHNGDVHLIYKIEGKPNEVDVFELGRMLDSIGNVISETNRIIRKPD